MSMRRIVTLIGTSVGAVLAVATIAAAPALADTVPDAGSTWTQPQAGSTWTQPAAGSAWTDAQAQSANRAAAGHLLVDTGQDLTRVTSLGTDAKTLVTGKDAQRKYGSYAPDGSTIAYTDTAKGKGFGAQLWTMKVDGTGRRQITTLDNQATCPKFSPDGKTVAFQVVTGGTASIWTVSATGGNAHQVTPADNGYYGACVSWAPTGASFVVARGEVDERSGEPFNWDIYSVRADGKGLTQLTRTAGDKNSPAYSPDGGTIVFSNITEQGMQTGAQYDLWSIKADGSAARQLTNTKNVAEQAAVFSPNGGQIAYASWKSTEATPRVATAKADGTSVQQLATAGYPTSWH
jgi:Tol biopolymer transport system component